MEINYGFEKVRSLAPVTAGAHVQGKFTLLSQKPKRAGKLRRFSVEVEIEGNEKPAMIAEWLVLVMEGEN